MDVVEALRKRIFLLPKSFSQDASAKPFLKWDIVTSSGATTEAGKKSEIHNRACDEVVRLLRSAAAGQARHCYRSVPGRALPATLWRFQLGQGICTPPWPGTVIEITPPQIHVSLDSAFRAGAPPSITVGDPGAHGVGVTGTQGTGVSTPCAAAVAEATAGLAINVHMPNGMMFAVGT